jgi:magnesium chelatase subunit D
MSTVRPPVLSALAVFAVAPLALGGVCLRSRAGPARDAWLQALRDRLPGDMPWRKMPLHASDDALLGGLDLAATLAQGRPVAERGLLAQADGGIVVAAMAERLSPARAALLAAALDGQATSSATSIASVAVIALDEGDTEDEHPPTALKERLALHVTLEGAATAEDVEAAQVQAARKRWRAVTIEPALLEAVVAAAAALGVDSSRTAWHAVVATRIAAALAGRSTASTDDAARAVQLVLAPRATKLPAAADDAPAEPPPAPDTPPPAPPDDPGEEQALPDQPLDDRLVAAAQAAIPPGLLALLAAGRAPKRSPRGDTGRVGSRAAARQRGRPIGVLRGEPRGGARLALVDTLRTAAPWQKVRRAAHGGDSSGRVFVARDDLRIQRRIHARTTTTIFAIDASGSQALHRLAEAKGAVELLLADCYARRDRVAVIGFRGAGAELLLPPTRSLVRAKRQLAGLPGGGGTPLALGIDAAHALAMTIRRGGATPLVVFLTDGRANIGRSGQPGRAEAQAHALAAARQFGASGVAALLIDTSPQSQPAALALAQAMGARCIALPYATATTMSSAVSGAVQVERAQAAGRHG